MSEEIKKDVLDSVAGGGVIISLPAYLMAGIPAHLAAGTNKVVNGCGTLVATTKYFRSGKVRLRPAAVAAVAALLGSVLGAQLASMIPEGVPIVLVEEGIRDGGASMILSERLSEYYEKTPPTRILAIPDHFAAPDRPCDLLAWLGLDAAGISSAVTELLKKSLRNIISQSSL